MTGMGNSGYHHGSSEADLGLSDSRRNPPSNNMRPSMGSAMGGLLRLVEVGVLPYVRFGPSGVV